MRRLWQTLRPLSRRWQSTCSAMVSTAQHWVTWMLPQRTWCVTCRPGLSLGLQPSVVLICRVCGRGCVCVCVCGCMRLHAAACDIRTF